MRGVIFWLLLISAATGAFAQKWEFGVDGGAGLLNTVSASSPAGNATAGFAPGFVAGVFAGENLYRNLSGEIRYEYMQSDLRLSSGGGSAQFSGGAHVIHYDLLYHTHLSDSRAQFFGVVGGGIKDFVGTGTEAAYQPLSQYGYFTKTNAVKPVITAGAGFIFTLTPKLSIRAEVRDFVTAFPNAVLTPAPGVRFGSVLQEIVPMVSFVYRK